MTKIKLCLCTNTYNHHVTWPTISVSGMSITSMKEKVILTFFNKGTEVEQFTVTHNTEHCSCGKLSWVIRFQEKTFMVKFANEKCKLYT